MQAIVETALLYRLVKFGKSKVDAGEFRRRRRKVANARGVDDLAATWQVMQDRGTRGMASFARPFGKGLRRNGKPRNQRITQRRFANA